MKPIVCLLLSSLAAISVAQAQSATQPTASRSTLLDVTGAVGERRGYVAASAWQLWSPFGQQRVQAGVGVRATGFFLPGQSYSSQNGSDAHLQLPAVQSLALNAALHLRAHVAGPVRIGFNIDLAGLTLGQDQFGQRQRASMTESVLAKPVRGNLLLGGVRDRGSLNSDLYVSVDIATRYSLHAGFSHVVNAYGVADQRFQRFANQGALGISYQVR